MFKELNKRVLMSECIRLVIAEERIHELEDRSIEIIQYEKLRGKNWININKALDIWQDNDVKHICDILV